MKVAILGSGNGGLTAAADWSLAGHEVRLFDFPEFTQQLEAVIINGGVQVTGDLTGMAHLAYAGHDLARALEGARLILAVGPSYSSEAFANAVKDIIKKDQVYIVCPGSFGGALITKKIFNAREEARLVCVGETATLPYASRIVEPGVVNVFLKLKGGVFLSTIPSSETQRVTDIFKEVYPGIEPAQSVLQTMLQNANPVIHPVVTLLNAGVIERTHGDLLFYEEGVTPAVGRVMRAVDQERVKLGDRLGVKVIPDPQLGMRQGYMTEDSYEYGYAKASGFKGIKAQSQLDHRYLNEDVGYGLVFMSELARKLEMDTPMIDAMIHIASAVMDRDYRNEAARTLDSIGYTIEDIQQENFLR